MTMKIHGNAFRYGRNVDTDVIIPARHLVSTDPEYLGQHCLEDLDPTFLKRMKKGDIIVAEENFGCGSSREAAPVALKAAGVGAIVAASFARIFYRNAINMGLPIFESPEAVAGIADGDEVEIDSDAGIIRNLTKGASYGIAPFPPFVQEIIDRGGLMEYVEERLAKK
jgi:3-isopropylmalate/(R)-2-methylmalate dehydratase small subunit